MDCRHPVRMDAWSPYVLVAWIPTFPNSAFPLCKRGIEGDFAALALRTTALNPPYPPLLKGECRYEASCRITRLIFLDRGIGQTPVSSSIAGAYITKLFRDKPGDSVRSVAGAGESFEQQEDFGGVGVPQVGMLGQRGIAAAAEDGFEGVEQRRDLGGESWLAP
jgi:hypothetical protein